LPSIRTKNTFVTRAKPLKERLAYISLIFKHRAEYVANPKVGDIYTISEPRNDGTAYYFLRIAEIKGDTVMAIHSSLEYNYFVNYMVGDDHFVKDDTSLYVRKRLQSMLENGEIYMVKRDYGKSSGFNQIR
jgi:hypothetical protein